MIMDRKLSNCKNDQKSKVSHKRNQIQFYKSWPCNSNTNIAHEQ